MTVSNSAWLQFLQQQVIPPSSASLSDSGGGSMAPLSHLGLISVTGEDAARFLHSQLTNDVEHLAPGQARLAAYCSPKGRMLASMLLVKVDDAILIQLPRELLPAIQKRLQMFVLRAKVKLADVSDSMVAIGLLGATAAEALQAWHPVPLPVAAYGTVSTGSGLVLRMPDAAGQARYQLLLPEAEAQAAWIALSGRLQAVDPAGWRLTEIQAGLPMILTATQEKFVPQMINFELIGGVNFRKGCYPGQEIVARSQYLGKLKRRMLPAEIETAQAAPGTDIYASSDPGQPAGQVVNAEHLSADRMLALIELKTALLEDGSALHLGSPDGPRLQPLPSPYPLTDPA